MNESMNGNFSGSGEFNKLISPEGRHLSAIFGGVVVGLVVVAVVSVVTATVCNTRRKRAKIYYTFAKTLIVQPQVNDGTGSIKSNAGLVNEQLRSGEGEGESMELVITQETSTQIACSQSETTLPLPSHQLAQLPVGIRASDTQTHTQESVGQAKARSEESEKEKGSDEHARKGSSVVAATAQVKNDQFAFEDGTLLQDYPAGVDLELTGCHDNQERATTRPYSDIYSSQILLNLAASSSTLQDSGQFLRPPLPERYRLGPPAPPSPHTAGYTAGDQSVPRGPSKELREVEDFLNQSLTDLLEMTQAMEAEIESSYDDSMVPPNPQSLRRQRSSLPTLLEPHTLTPSQHSLPPPNIIPSSLRASRASTVDLSEVATPGDLANLDPRVRSTILCDDFTELQVTHV